MARRRARGEGSIRKRKDGRWEGRYTIGRDKETGKLIYKNVLAKTQAECKRKLGEAINQQQESVENDIYRKNDATVSLPESCASRKQTLQENHDTYTVGHWLNTWYELYSKPNLRRSTQVQYSYFIKDILLILSRKSVCKAFLPVFISVKSWDEKPAFSAIALKLLIFPSFTSFSTAYIKRFV